MVKKIEKNSGYEEIAEKRETERETSPQNVEYSQRKMHL